MSEGSESPKPTLLRRDFFKKAGIGAAVLGTTGLGLKEVWIGNEGLSTPNAVFFPFYEHHDKGINPENLPENLDALFKEGQMNGSHYDVDPTLFLNALRTDLVNKMAAHRMKLIVGDTDVSAESRSGLEGDASLARQEMLAGLGIGSASYLYNNLSGLVDDFKRRVPDKKGVSRRNLLKRAGYAAAGYLLLPVTSTILDAGAVLAGINPDQKDAITRIATRVGGMVHNTHPEQLAIFFRNLIMADKMLTVAEKMKNEKGEKANIGFNLGSAHAGIEDMLLAGPEFCRYAISLYPAEFLKTIVAINGTPEKAATAIVISIPKEYKASDGQAENPISERVPREKVVDTRLVDVLNSKLGKVS